MARVLVPMLFALCLGACAGPPRSAYVQGADQPSGPRIRLGSNAAGEPCTQRGGAGARGASIYCGAWEQPSARIAEGDTQGAATLAQIASDGAWRVALEQRMSCGSPETATLLGQPAQLLRCARKPGGWPQIAMLTAVNGRLWYADGVASSLPVMERGIGVLSGRIASDAADAAPVNAGLEAQRLAQSSVSSNDMGRYEQLVRAANAANLSGNYPQAEFAYRSVAALQSRVLGTSSPALARTLASQALQVSNQGRCAEAAALLQRAELRAAAPDQTDTAALPLVWHYRGLHLLNCGSPAEALDWLQRAEAGYRALLPPNALQAGRPESAGRSSASGLQDAMESRELLADETSLAALYGVVETRRAEAAALRRMGQTAEGDRRAVSAAQIAHARGLDSDPKLAARVYRTEAFAADASGHAADADALLLASKQAFSRGLPDTLSYGQTALLLARREAVAGRSAAALADCREAVRVLRDDTGGVPGTLLAPCLAVMHDAAAPGPDGEKLRREMFEAAQLAQGSTTSFDIAKASARLAENARDPKVAELISAHDTASAALGELNIERDQQAGAGQPVDPALDARIAAVQARQAETDAALQAAVPNYNQLVQRLVSAKDVFAALRPGEAFVSTMLGGAEGWVFLLREDAVRVAPIPGGEPRVAGLVARVRHSLDADMEPPPPFDTAAAAELYTVVLGGVSAGLHGATSMTVAPTGPLLSVPFGLLLTGPATADTLATAPWLIRDLAIAHVPAPANFVGLRKLAGVTRASRPWFGFGDFRPVTQVQAAMTFPVQACGDSAALLAGLPPLPGAQQELAAVRQLLGGEPQDELLGAGFTAAAVANVALQHYRVLHFATHALLPTDLKCESEPALVTSPPPGAADASGALLTASAVTSLKLDADAVILSACNTGGPAGAAAGESLSGLARSFFYAGARGLLVTHWSVNDRAAAYLVALTLAGMRQTPALGLEGSLAAAQRTMIAEAKGGVSGQAHPFYWAPLALIGEGSGPPPSGLQHLALQ